METSKTEYKQYLKQEFWDDFYKKMKNEANELEYFEWYTDYKGMKELIHKYINKSDSILSVGCGKSLLSENLYDEGFQNISNIDYSESIIAHMKERSVSRTKMTYSVGDVNKMAYQEEKFNVVFDKGTLDAIYPTINEKETVYEYLNSCYKTVKDNGGKVIVISLLQSHIISLLAQFATLKNCKFTIEEIDSKDGTLNPFFCVLEKQTQATIPKIELNLQNNKMTDITALKCIEEIRNRQSLQIFEKNSKCLCSGERFTFKLFSKDDPENAKYTLIIVDSPSPQVLKNNTCGVFVTPKDKETGYIFGTEDGNFILLEQTKLSRLIIVHLSPFCTYGDMDQIKSDLNPYVSKFIPNNCENEPCPYMTDSDETDPREIIFKGKNFFVDEVDKEEDGKFRRMIAFQSQCQIQSQVKLRGNGMIDWSYLDFETHKLALIPISYAFSKQNDLNLLMLGSAGQVFSTFIQKSFPKIQVTCIDNDSETFEIAKNHFEAEGKSNNQTKDAYEFISKASNSSYDCVFIDINNSDESSNCPPDQFRGETFLKNLSNAMKPDSIALFNCIFRDEFTKNEFLYNLVSVGFESIYRANIEEERNCLFFAHKIVFERLDGKLVLEQEKVLDKVVLGNHFKSFQAESDLKWDSTMNLDQLVSNFELIFPKVSNAFSTSEVLVKNQKGELTTATKEMYLNDQAKIDKKKQKKSKKTNKSR